MIMNVKNFLVAGFVGGIVDWLLGWLFYGIIFKSIYGGAEDGSDMNMLMITFYQGVCSLFLNKQV